MKDKDSGAGLAAGGNDTTAASPQRQAHTPGPWTTGPTIYKHMAAEIREGEDGIPIAQLWRNDAVYANAHLIASAPELLEALIGFVRHFDGNNLAEGDWPLMDQALAALKKAEAR